MAQPTKKTYGWGIIGCGKIAHDFCNVLLNHKRSNIIACGARSLSKSQNFAQKFNIPSNNAYSSYDQVCKNELVDIVYIATIHPTHCKAIMNALNNGKHVLCEKPIAMNAIELQKMIECAKKNNKFLIDGMWTRFFPSFRKARSWIENGEIGDITAYFADTGRPSSGPNKLPRIWDNSLGGGALLDIGCYAINPITWVFGGKFPDKMIANGVIHSEYKVDLMDSISFTFNNDRKTQFGQINCNILTNTVNEYRICGTHGYIKFMTPAHKCTELVLCKYDEIDRKNVVSKQVMEYKLPNVKEFKFGFNYRCSEGFGYEIDTLLECLDRGLIECPEYKWKEMMLVMKFMDETRKQIGLKYEADYPSKL